MLDSVTDTGLGGKTIDKAYVDYFAKEFKKKFKVDITGDKRAVAKLTAAAVNAKKILSTKASTAISVESLHDGMDFQCKVMRARVDVSLGKEYRKCTGPIQLLLDKCGLKVEDVTDVILAGGASKMPKIKSTLAGFFGNAEIIKDTIAPDEVSLRALLWRVLCSYMRSAATTLPPTPPSVPSLLSHTHPPSLAARARVVCVCAWEGKARFSEPGVCTHDRLARILVQAQHSPWLLCRSLCRWLLSVPPSKRICWRRWAHRTC